MSYPLNLGSYSIDQWAACGSILDQGKVVSKDMLLRALTLCLSSEGVTRALYSVMKARNLNHPAFLNPNIPARAPS